MAAGCENNLIWTEDDKLVGLSDFWLAGGIIIGPCHPVGGNDLFVGPSSIVRTFEFGGGIHRGGAARIVRRVLLRTKARLGGCGTGDVLTHWIFSPSGAERGSVAFGISCARCRREIGMRVELVGNIFGLAASRPERGGCNGFEDARPVHLVVIAGRRGTGRKRSANAHAEGIKGCRAVCRGIRLRVKLVFDGERDSDLVSRAPGGSWDQLHTGYNYDVGRIGTAAGGYVVDIHSREHAA